MHLTPPSYTSRTNMWDVLARNFQLALHSIQWFFANAAERKEGIYRLVLAHSHFSDNTPFLNVAQHASFVASFDGSLEPPLHRRMFALETALPHHGTGSWEDLVPAVPSLDCLTQEWEAMMLNYIHFVTNTPLPQAGPHEEISDLQEGVGVGTAAIPLFLPDPLSPTPVASPVSLPPPPPLFGSVADLAIDITADDDDKDIYESVGSIECPTIWRIAWIVLLVDNKEIFKLKLVRSIDLGGLFVVVVPFHCVHLSVLRIFLSTFCEVREVVPLYHSFLLPLPSSFSLLLLPIPPVCPSKPPPRPPMHPFPEKTNASAMAAASLDASRANSAGAQWSPPFLPILPKS
ncbi:hypothetical protein F5876DRAFT_82375 [Lentinula aff. lateritia]|uniref:Uncharacterized protein n=1 Tax=Lentinula aff. lateritia TaxID=2804960 RepID=A0ACC1TK19_9AGAR|nr:hypothetical protein F5876DRAFT_82375 [Lentinula aff. lateritia]